MPPSESFAGHDFRTDIVAVQGIAAVPLILDVACRLSGMGFAAVARVTEDRWVACAVRDAVGFDLEPGGELRSATSPRRENRRSRQAVADDGDADDATCSGSTTPGPYGSRSHVSVPIVLPNGSVFGILCAFDRGPARVNAPEVIGTFELFADLIGFHLDADPRVATGTAAQRLYEDIVQSDAAPICVFDTGYRLIAFNKAHNDEFRRVNGFVTKLGDVFPDLFIPEQAAVMRANMGRALTGETFKVEAEFGRPEFGQPAWEIAYTPLRDADGQVTGAFHQAHDISARRIAEADLRDAEELLRQSQKLDAIGQLTGGVAHDFNNLLTVIKSSSDLLKRPDLTTERRARYVETISDTADRATRLTAQLLAFARRQALNPEVFDAGVVLRDTVEMLATILDARVHVVTVVSERPSHVRADRSQFETALVNMAVNAADAMNGEGTLTLRLSPGSALPPIRGQAGDRGPFVRLEITDSGSGIEPATLAKIFEPFFTTKEVGKGTGLGLSQVFGFAKQSGGDVDVASERGTGTTFTLYLPETAASPPDAPGREVRASGPADATRLRVLVVEDNHGVGRSTLEALTDLGHAPTWVVDAREALVRLEDDPDGYDVVFTDVVMPGESGVDLARAIGRSHPGLPVVLTSGFSRVLADQGRLGFELLQKPYSIERLAEALALSVAGRDARHGPRDGEPR